MYRCLGSRRGSLSSLAALSQGMYGRTGGRTWRKCSSKICSNARPRTHGRRQLLFFAHLHRMCGIATWRPGWRREKKDGIRQKSGPHRLSVRGRSAVATAEYTRRRLAPPPSTILGPDRENWVTACLPSDLCDGGQGGERRRGRRVGNQCGSWTRARAAGGQTMHEYCGCG